MAPRVEDIKQILHSDPEILGGTPVFVGTRVPVQTLFDYLEALLIRIHHESARHQATARRNQERARQEFFKRLEGVQVEQGGVVMSTVTTRQVIRMLEAETPP